MWRALRQPIHDVIIVSGGAAPITPLRLPKPEETRHRQAKYLNRKVNGRRHRRATPPIIDIAQGQIALLCDAHVKLSKPVGAPPAKRDIIGASRPLYARACAAAAPEIGANALGGGVKLPDEKVAERQGCVAEERQEPSRRGGKSRQHVAND